MSKILNAEGPSIRTATQWRNVTIEERCCAKQIHKIYFI